MQLFAVVATSGGAHEADAVYSLWTTQEKADAEVARLKVNDVQCGCNDGTFIVAPVTVDQSSNGWIPWDV